MCSQDPSAGVCCERGWDESISRLGAGGHFKNSFSTKKHFLLFNLSVSAATISLESWHPNKTPVIGPLLGENWPASSDFQDVKYILQPSLIILYSCIQSSCIDRNFTLTNTMDRDFVNFALLIKTFYFHWFFELHKWTIVFWRIWAMAGLAESGHYQKWPGAEK